MPIKPENLQRYPKDWKQIRERILERAGNCCESCGVGNHWHGYRDHEGKFHLTYWDETRCLVWPAAGTCETTPENVKSFEIVLTIAHLDHTPENCADENLRAFCQRCHLSYDAKHHQETAYQTRRSGKAARELFDSPGDGRVGK